MSSQNEDCNHEWEWKGSGGDPAAPLEPEQACKHCGMRARVRLTDEQIAQQVAGMQARLDTCAQNGQAYRVKWHEVKSIIATVQTLRQRLAEEKKWHGDHEEREAAVCPEDVPCDEYIRHLEAALSSRDTEIREVLEGLRNNHGCWCPGSEEHEFREPFVCGPDCKRAQVLYAKVQPKESRDDD